ncbi:hypothetical protein DVH26_26445 [Paenibacillus sp. H1-7]|nr:hypothetical protein DVH26_26445 [Paenibacillus sp. H1-7]
MMCQEVIELMQRYLDQDLDEMEYEQMLGHLQQCPDCTELFQRLVALSQELEQLPKVTPAYSLVDAILPKLQRIDEGYPAVEFPAAAIPPVSAPQDNLGAEQESKVAEVEGWRRRMRGWVSMKIVGGVVAAGLVLGFFVFDQQQQHTANTEAGGMLLPQSAQSKSAGSESKTPAADSNANKPMLDRMTADTTEKSDAKLKTDNSTADPAAPVPGPNKAEEMVEPNQARTVQPKSEPLDTTRQQVNEAVPTPPAEQQAPDDSAQAPDVSDQAPAAALSVPEADSVPPAAGGSSGAVSPSTESPLQKSGEPSVPSDAARGMMNKTIAPDERQQGFAQTPTDTKDAAKDKAQDAPINGLFSISGTAVAGSTLASKDHAYVAVVTEQRQVVIRDNQGKDLFISSNKWTEKDKVELTEWTEDGKLSYKVTSGTAVTTYTIDMKAKTEVKK